MDELNKNEFIKFNPKYLTLSDSSPRLKYVNRPLNEKRNVHWGQRKLLLSEIQFLTDYGEDEIDSSNPPIVLYIGSAPGTHLISLVNLFPDYEYHLYDPREFDPHLFELPEIKSLNNMFFSDDEAKRWRETNRIIYFISDIRTADYTTMSKLEFEDAVIQDLERQSNWVKIIQPTESLLKFRLPFTDLYPEDTIKYLDGSVYVQVWAPRSSSETRLIPDNKLKEINWNIEQYDDQGFYFTSMIREHDKFFNPFTGDTTPIDYPELLNDFDSTAEAYILNRYLNIESDGSSYDRVIELSRKITEELNIGKPRNKWITLSRIRENVKSGRFDFEEDHYKKIIEKKRREKLKK
jgi:hypothetical protein